MFWGTITLMMQLVFCQLCSLKFLPLTSLCVLTQTHGHISWINYLTLGLLMNLLSEKSVPTVCVSVAFATVYKGIHLEPWHIFLINKPALLYHCSCSLFVLKIWLGMFFFVHARMEASHQAKMLMLNANMLLYFHPLSPGIKTLCFWSNVLFVLRHKSANAYVCHGCCVVCNTNIFCCDHVA